MNTTDAKRQFARGRPYVLVVMAYKKAGSQEDLRVKLFEMIKEVVERDFGLACIRADEELQAGDDLLSKIHLLIERAALVVVEISEPRPNVFYELGYSMGLRKTPLLIMETGSDKPYDLQGLEVLEYQNDWNVIDSFRRNLSKHLHVRLRSEWPMLRNMLAPHNPEKSYIVASPKYPDKNSRLQGQVNDTRTFGDYVAILGVIAAFGSLYGDTKNVELVSAQLARKDLLKRNVNLFLIGSPKVNELTADALHQVCRKGSTQWEFGPEFGSAKRGDWPVALYRSSKGAKTTKLVGERMKIGAGRKAEIWRSDYGLIVRSPHPSRRDRLVLIMAGAHSLGTAAAGLAATRAPLIEKIHAMLPEGAMEDKSSKFWALVHARVSQKDYLLDEESVRIEEVGVL